MQDIGRTFVNRFIDSTIQISPHNIPIQIEHKPNDYRKNSINHFFYKMNTVIMKEIVFSALAS